MNTVRTVMKRIKIKSFRWFVRYLCGQGKFASSNVEIKIFPKKIIEILEGGGPGQMRMAYRNGNATDIINPYLIRNLNN